jgi:hypothetical protein
MGALGDGIYLLLRHPRVASDGGPLYVAIGSLLLYVSLLDVLSSELRSEEEGLE